MNSASLESISMGKKYFWFSSALIRLLLEVNVSGHNPPSPLHKDLPYIIFRNALESDIGAQTLSQVQRLIVILVVIVHVNQSLQHGLLVLVIVCDVVSTHMDFFFFVIDFERLLVSESTYFISLGYWPEKKSIG
jgi:hypothetical protein